MRNVSVGIFVSPTRIPNSFEMQVRVIPTSSISLGCRFSYVNVPVRNVQDKGFMGFIPATHHTVQERSQ